MVGESRSKKPRGRPRKRESEGEPGHRLSLDLPLAGNIDSPSLDWPDDIEIDDGDLVWHWYIGGVPNRHMIIPEPERPVLFDFARVWSLADSEKVLFAKKWGLLLNYVQVDDDQLRASGLPHSGRMVTLPGPITLPRTYLVFDGPIREPIATWNQLSRRAEAVMGILADIRAGTPPAEDDLTLIYPAEWPEPWERQFHHGQSRDEALPAEQRLFHELNNWLHNGPPKVVFPVYRRWEDARMVCETPTLMSRVAVELASAATSEPGLYRCSRCHRPYWPVWRRPVEGEARYCDPCKADARRERQRRYMKKEETNAPTSE